MRKLMMLAAMALTAMAVVGASATTAAASFQVQNPTTHQPCPAVQVINGAVSGGCLVDDLEGSFDIDGLPSFYHTYPAEFDVRVGADGKGWAHNITIQQPPYGPFWYYACDVGGIQQPWEVITYPHPVTGKYFFTLKMQLRYNGSSSCSQVVPVVHDGGNSMGPAGVNLDQLQDAQYIKNASWSATGSVGAEWVDLP